MTAGFAVPPVVVGGVGGSGTRVVAEMLETLGLFIGDDLNDARDNMTLGRVFEATCWRRRTRSPISPDCPSSRWPCPRHRDDRAALERVCAHVAARFGYDVAELSAAQP